MLMAFMAYRGQFDSRVTSLIDKAIDLKMLRLHAERLADLTEADEFILVSDVFDPALRLRSLDIAAAVMREGAPAPA